jgi:hypothetical protein
MFARWFLAALFASVLSAAGHDWYPLECCHGLDCAPVDRVEVLSGPAFASIMGSTDARAPSAMRITTRHGSVIVPADFPRRESKDNRMHACIRNQAGTARLICLFLPPSM